MALSKVVQNEELKLDYVGDDDMWRLEFRSARGWKYFTSRNQEENFD